MQILDGTINSATRTQNFKRMTAWRRTRHHLFAMTDVQLPQAGRGPKGALEIPLRGSTDPRSDYALVKTMGQ